jgi:hypothetical protein
LPIFRTPGVWKGIGIGLVVGILLTLGAFHVATHYCPTRASGECRNRADSIDAHAGGAVVIPADTCDVSRNLPGMPDASGPVRFRVKLLLVVDGDTIRVLWHGEDMSVRLLGIDTPERDHPGFEEAANHLRDLLAETDTIDLEFPAAHPRRDSLGRLLATVWLGGRDINRDMLESGNRNGGRPMRRDGRYHFAWPPPATRTPLSEFRQIGIYRDKIA